MSSIAASCNICWAVDGHALSNTIILRSHLIVLSRPQGLRPPKVKPRWCGAYLVLSYPGHSHIASCTLLVRNSLSSCTWRSTRPRSSFEFARLVFADLTIHNLLSDSLKRINTFPQIFFYWKLFIAWVGFIGPLLRVKQTTQKGAVVQHKRLHQ